MANIYKEIFCEWDALVEFADLMPAAPAADSEDNAASREYESWRSVRNLLLSSVVHFDKTFEEFVNFLNKYANGKAPGIFKSIQKRLSSGYIKCDGPNFPDLLACEDINQLKSSALYIVKDERKEKVGERCGLFVISSDRYREIIKYTHVKNLSCNKGIECDNWNFLGNHCIHNFNAIVIVDNYLYKGDETFDVNLGALLRKLIPKSLSSELQVSVITTKVKERNGKEYPLSNLANRISNLLGDIGVKYLSLNIYEITTSEIHDRFIITNNGYFSSSIGFGDLFHERKNTARKNAEILSSYPMCVPYDNHGIQDILVNRIKECRECTNNHKPIYGVAGNRLLSDDNGQPYVFGN